MTEAAHVHFRRHRFPAEIIAHAVWLYYRFPLRFRDVEDLLAERGINVSFQTVSEWATKFGLKFAHQLRRRSRGQFADKCWVGRPPNGIKMCQSELLRISNEGAVRGADYPYWHGYVKACLSIAWCERRRATDPAQEDAPKGDGGFLCEMPTDRDWS